MIILVMNIINETSISYLGSLAEEQSIIKQITRQDIRRYGQRNENNKFEIL